MLKDIKESLKGMLEHTEDKEEIERISKVIGQVEQEEKEREAELAKIAQLKKEYRDMVINSHFPDPSKKPNEEGKAPTEDHKDAPSFEGALDEAIKNVLEKPKEDK